MTLTFPYSSAPVRQIREIQFGVMSPEEIVSDRFFFSSLHFPFPFVDYVKWKDAVPITIRGISISKWMAG
jgi:hypothetical protein